MKYIRKHYGVPAKRGARVVYEYDQPERTGTITSSYESYIRIRFDGETKTHCAPFHPTWKIRYLEGNDVK